VLLDYLHCIYVINLDYISVSKNLFMIIEQLLIVFLMMVLKLFKSLKLT
jgi:hypothetical protein